MYTQEELHYAAGIIRSIALENGVPEAEVRAEMEKAMNYGRHDPDPAVQARWASFHFAGAEPTIEEFILWMTEVAQSIKDG